MVQQWLAYTSVVNMHMLPGTNSLYRRKDLIMIPVAADLINALIP